MPASPPVAISAKYPLPDYWELQHGIDAAGNDEDGDQIPNLSEYQLGTDPNSSDSPAGSDTGITTGDRFF